MSWYPLIKEGQLSHKYAITSPVEPMNLLSKGPNESLPNIDPPYGKMSLYPLIEKGQRSYKYAFLRASGAMLLRIGASLKRVNGAIILENVLVPPCSILLGGSHLARRRQTSCRFTRKKTGFIWFVRFRDW